MKNQRRSSKFAKRKASPRAFTHRDQLTFVPLRSVMPQASWPIVGLPGSISMDNGPAMMTPRVEGVEPELAGSMMT